LCQGTLNPCATYSVSGFLSIPYVVVAVESDDSKGLLET